MLLQILKIISLTGILFAIGLFAPLSKNEFLPQSNRANVTAGEETASEPETQSAEPVQLEAKSAYVYDLLENKPLFELNPDKQMPLASLTKLITAVVAEESLLKMELAEISKEAVLQDGDSGLNVGELRSLTDLLKIMLVSSSNDAAFAIAASYNHGGNTPTDTDFVKLMNDKVRELGLADTYFLNSTGLDISTITAGAYGTCKDMAALMKYALQKYPELLEITGKESITIQGRIFKNTDELAKKLPFFIAGKTGYSDLAGGNLIIAVDKPINHPVIIMVLGSSFDGRFKDVETLYNKYVKSN